MPDVEFPKAEYEQRYERAWTLMREQGFGALLVTSEPNHRYFTGHRTQFWVSLSRPMYTILPLGRPPVCLVTEVESAVLKETSYVKDIRTWVGFAAESVPILVGILNELGLKGEKIGVDYGNDMRLGMPLPAFETLKAEAKGMAFVDGSPLLWDLRFIKSPREIEYIRKSVQATAAGLKHGWKIVKPGMTHRELHRRMTVAMLEAGADKVKWFPIQAGAGNYTKFSMEPGNAKFKKGDTLWADIGTTVNGYWSDFNRVCSVGGATPEKHDTYQRVREITRTCIEAVRPGIPISSIVAVRDQAYRKMGFVEPGGRSGRMGHGSGLDITEPPSVGSFDQTILKPGMVIHVEPKMVRPYGCFQLEEIVEVTKAGYKDITTPAPKRLPVVG